MKHKPNRKQNQHKTQQQKWIQQNKTQNFKKLVKKSDFLINIIGDTHTKLGSLLSVEKIEKRLSDTAIIFNINFDSISKKDEIKKELSLLYGMEGRINNVESFLLFCSIHGFSPRINDITINGKNISKYPDLESLVRFVLKEKDLLFSQDIMNDIQKINPQTLQAIGIETIKEIIQTIIVFSRYNLSEYGKIYGDKIQKLKMTNTFAENIFLEIAMRLEKQVRKKLEITSTYMHLANFDEDMYFKTDMKFLFRKKSSDHYIPYPVQFTLGKENSHNMKRKEEKIEHFLAERIRKKTMGYKDFIVLGVNGGFTEYITSPEIKNAYDERRKDPERRKHHEKELFPFFMDQLKNKKILPAQTMYLVLNKIYSEFDFSKDSERTHERKKVDFWKGISDERSINNIEIPKIKIFAKYKQLVIPSNKRYWDAENRTYIMTKRRFSINYAGEHIGRISIYRNPEKR